MADIIVAFDVVHIDGLCHIFVLIEFTGIAPRVGIVCQTVTSPRGSESY
jgi:hypothetical protein